MEARSCCGLNWDQAFRNATCSLLKSPPLPEVCCSSQKGLLAPVWIVMGFTLTLFWWRRKYQCFRSSKVTYLDAWKMSNLVTNVLKNARKHGKEYGLNMEWYNQRGQRIVATLSDTVDCSVLLPEMANKCFPAYLRVTGSLLHRSNNLCHLSITLAFFVNAFSFGLLLWSHKCLASQLYGEPLFILLCICEAVYVLSMLLTFCNQQEFQELVHRGSAWHVLKNQLGFYRQRRDCEYKLESVPIWNTSFKAKDQEGDTTLCEHEKKADDDLKLSRETSIKAFDNAAAAGWVNVVSGLAFAIAVTILPLNSADPASVNALGAASLTLVGALLSQFVAFKEYNTGVHSFRELVRSKEAVQSNYIHKSARWYEKDCAFTTWRDGRSRWCMIKLPQWSEVCRSCLHLPFNLIFLNSYRPKKFVLVELAVVRGGRRYTALLKKKQ